MDLNRRSLMAAGAGLGLAGAGAGGAMAAPRGVPRQEQATLSLENGTERPQTDAIQQALDRSAESGAPVILPPGRFVTGSLKLSGGTKLIGAHGATHLIACDPEALIGGTSLAAVRLEGLVLDGEGIAEHLVRLEGCGGLVTDCTIKGARETGLFALDSRDLVISFNRISNCLNNGLQIWRSVVGRDGTQVVSNRIEGIRALGGGSGENGNGINVFRADEVQVSGNAIRDCAYSAVRGNSSSNIQIIANTCRQLGEVAIYSEFGFEGAVIAQNVVDGAASGIAVTNFNEGGRLASVQGNLVRNLKRRHNEPVDKRGEGIAVEADTVVSGNVIEEAEAAGILIGWGPYMRNVAATGNVIRNAEIGIGITSDLEAGACLVSGNMISGARKGAIRAFERSKLVGADLALEETLTERVRISGNVAA